jgi:diguanylate cyclase
MTFHAPVFYRSMTIRTKSTSQRIFGEWLVHFLCELISVFVDRPNVLRNAGNARNAAMRGSHMLLTAAIAAFTMIVGTASYANHGPLTLNDRDTIVDAWPYARVLYDKDKSMTPEQAVAAIPRFESIHGSYATLGVRPEAAWLHFELNVDSMSDGHWIVDIDYPPLQQLDVYLLQQGQIKQSAKLGSLRPFELRPLLSRSHATEIDVKGGQQYDVLIRVETLGAMVVPITLEKPVAFHDTAIREQLLQGLLIGLALSLLIYSLAQWWSTREPLFLKYSLLVVGGLLFTLLQLGIGAQYVWTNNFWIERHIGGLSALMAIGGTFLFLEEALREHNLLLPGSVAPRRTFQRIMWGGAILCAILAILFSTDVFNTSVMTLVVTVMGPLPSLICMPQFIQRARRRDPIGIYLIIAWTIYMIVVIIITAMIRGQLPVNFWTQHSFQFGATFDMLAWMYVLSLRTRATRQAVQHASLERDVMRTLAHTDPLTGLANRRSLNDALSVALRRSSSERLLAVYVIDVDAFKPVNDTYGHDIGDELLIAISQLLKANVRAGDVVARFGGDEFVVLAHGLRNEQQAQELGASLLGLFDTPIALSERSINVGLTIGFAIAPLDGNDTITLIKRADDAMYLGKQSGKGCLRRAGAPTVPNSASATNASNALNV